MKRNGTASLRLRNPESLALLLLLTCGTLAADESQTGPEALKNMSLEQLSQVEVTSPSRQATPAFRSPAAVYVITGEDIRRAGIRTIPDALRLAPGVEVAQIDANKWSVGIRGFGTRLSRDVLVLIDGRTVYTPLLAGTYWEVQDTLIEDIDRIEVIRGPGGTIWGPNAVNGVINIITKSAKDTQGAYAEAGGGSQEQGFFAARDGGQTSKGLSYRVYAKGFTRGPEHHEDGDNFDDWRGAQGGFRMDWTRGDRDSFTFQGDIYRQENGERVSLSTYVPAAEYPALDGNEELSGGNVLLRWTRKLKNGDDIEVQAYYDRTDRYEVNFGERRDTYDIDYLQHTTLPARQQLAYGLEARLSPDHFLEVGSGLVFYPFRRTDYLVSGFLQDEIDLIHNTLSLTAGSKFLRTNYTGVEFEPSVRLLWTPNDKQSFWAAFTHAVRTPSDAEEDFYLSSYLGTSNGLELFARFSPNKNFAPEQLNGYELGYRQLIGRGKKLYIDFAGFLNHYHDLFSQDLAGPLGLETNLPFPQNPEPPTHILIPAQFRNDLYGLTTGAEIAPEWRPTNFLRLRGSYSFLHMDLSKRQAAALGGTPSSITGASPQHEVSIDSSFDLSSKVQLDLVYRFVSALTAQSVPSYSTGDARLGWWVKKHVQLSVVGRNLMQPYHVEYVGDPGLPVGIVRSVFGSVAWLSK